MYIFTKILSAIIFFAFVCPISFILKFFNSDFLNKGIKKNNKSYWEKRG